MAVGPLNGHGSGALEYSIRLASEIPESPGQFLVSGTLIAGPGAALLPLLPLHAPGPCLGRPSDPCYTICCIDIIIFAQATYNIEPAWPSSL